MAFSIRSFSSLLGGGSSPDLTSWGVRRGNQFNPVTSNIKKPGTMNLYYNGSGNNKMNSKVDGEKIFSVIGTSLNKYMTRLDELGSYLESHITKTAVDVIKDAVVELFVLDNPNIISIPDDPVGEKAVNKILNDIQLGKHIVGDIADIIYYGSYSYSFGLNEKNQYELRYLKNPTRVVSGWKDAKLDSFYTYDLDNKMTMYSKDEVFSISTFDYKLDLDNNITSDRFKKIIGESERTNLELQQKRLEDERKSFNVRYLAGTPLYSNISNKVKEYILKDYLLSILSIKDLIQPIVLLVGMEKSTNLEEAVDLSRKVENIINQNVDMSFLEAKGLSVKELAMSLIDNIRVLPDYDSKLASMTDLNLDKLSDKIDRIRMDQMTIKEDIINSIGLPLDLFDGRSSRWESIKMSQRFESRIAYYVEMIEKSVILLAQNIYDKLKLPKKIDIEGKITCNLIDMESLQFMKKMSKMESLSEHLQRISDISNTLQMVEQSSIINVDELKKYIANSLNKLNDPELSKVIDPNKKVSQNDIGGGYGF